VLNASLAAILTRGNLSIVTWKGATLQIWRLRLERAGITAVLDRTNRNRFSKQKGKPRHMRNSAA
jgi:hypothetical protein